MTQNSANDKPMTVYTDEACMRLALAQANMAAEEGEVPVGAVVLWQGRIIARAHNQVELLKDATAHAEILALTQASAAKGDWRLDDCTLFVTKEPCAMCAGAMVNARLGSAHGRRRIGSRYHRLQRHAPSGRSSVWLAGRRSPRNPPVVFPPKTAGQKRLTTCLFV